MDVVVCIVGRDDERKALYLFIGGNTEPRQNRAADFRDHIIVPELQTGQHIDNVFFAVVHISREPFDQAVNIFAEIGDLWGSAFVYQGKVTVYAQVQIYRRSLCQLINAFAKLYI